MNSIFTMEEYEQVKDMTYIEYCDYLQNKYGIAQCDYMTKSFNKIQKVTRTKEGLIVHHKFEDHAIMLCNKEYAEKNPFEWQKKENLIYCNYLEHLFLHILICEHPAPDANPFEAVGIGGAINHIIPELNDFYSGMPISLGWKQKCFDAVSNQKDLYIKLVNRLIEESNDYPLFNIESIVSSFNERFGSWKATNNIELISNFENVYNIDNIVDDYSTEQISNVINTLCKINNIAIPVKKDLLQLKEMLKVASKTFIGYTYYTDETYQMSVLEYLINFAFLENPNMIFKNEQETNEWAIEHEVLGGDITTSTDTKPVFIIDNSIYFENELQMD